MTLKRITRKARPKKVNRLRKKREFERAYHSKARVLFVKSLPCAVRCCVYEQAIGTAATQNCHIASGGMGRKAAYAEIVPLCSWHHEILHHGGRRLFEKDYRIDLGVCAAATQLAWQAFQEGAR